METKLFVNLVVLHCTLQNLLPEASRTLLHAFSREPLHTQSYASQSVAVIIKHTFDGHTNNGGYYASLELSEGTWSYTNPYSDGNKQIFVYFDPMHLWKNIYSSFHSNSYMVLPRCPGAEEPESMRMARLSSLKVLASWGNYLSVKASYKLIQKVLARSLIKKQSIGLIMSAVNPYTVTGLRLLAMTTGKEKQKESNVPGGPQAGKHHSATHQQVPLQLFWCELLQGCDFILQGCDFRSEEEQGLAVANRLEEEQC
ncbi:uncharacterized protein LOC130915999 [Corythoichthys intestinalis]|uniref:uncharacterized protein LOC130915999 n=1 Tax=Corythoichthys intestinalis TaxID=161448 RepID=UPI0025A59F8F|nr:uncharacterized protein LOC130915999 [Corythoichthys intestinalis]